MSGRLNTREGEETVIPANAKSVTSFLARQRAIDRGALLDVSRLAKCEGYLIPVALTAAVVERYVLVPDDDAWDDEKVRVWDILQTLAHSIRRLPQEEHYFVWVEPNEPKSVWLKAVVGQGEKAEPVMTIMLPEQQ